MTPCARAFLKAPPVEEEAVVLLLAVDVDVDVPDDLVTVAVVDVLCVVEVDEVDPVEVDEVRPGVETDVSPEEGVAAPVVTALLVTFCPLHVAFPEESLPQVSPAAIRSQISVYVR
jgi:hypothetical protein